MNTTATNRRSLRELASIAKKYQLTFHGMTTKGHYRWLHGPTGRILTSISTTKGNVRALNNAERTFKTRLRELGYGHRHQN